MAAASNKLSAILLLISLLSYSTFTNACGSCNPRPPPPSPSPPSGKCPRDTLKLGVCTSMLGLGQVVVGTPASRKCCALLQGLVDWEVAFCLCTVIKANMLGMNLNVPVAFSFLVSACRKTIPEGFKCE